MSYEIRESESTFLLTTQNSKQVLQKSENICIKMIRVIKIFIFYNKIGQ